jgi:hypothetical protein
MGLYYPDEGKILIDGLDIKELSIQFLREKISMRLSFFANPFLISMRLFISVLTCSDCWAGAGVVCDVDSGQHHVWLHVCLGGGEDDEGG